MAQLVDDGQSQPVHGALAASLRGTSVPRRRTYVPGVSLSIIMALVDLVGLVIVGWFGYIIAIGQADGEWLSTDQGIIPGRFTGATSICVLLVCLTVHALGGYRPEVVSRAGQSAATIAIGVLCVAGFLFAVEAVAPLQHTLTLWLATSSGIAVPAAALWRVLALYLAAPLLSTMAKERTAVVLGAGPEAERFIAHLNRSRGSRPKILGCFDDRATRVSSAFGGVQCQGNVDDLIAFVRDLAIDEVIIALPWSAEERLATLIERVKVLPADIRLSPYGFGYRIAAPKATRVDGLPLLTAVPRPLRASDAVVKAIEDWAVGLGLLPLFLPIMTVIALVIRLDSPGPIFFRQPRHGWNNRVISVYKFRTMYVGATDLTGGLQTARDDNRITRVGRFLRRTSLDELPQLFNVLRGEMSVVGPRPHPIGMKTEEKHCHEIVSGYAQRHKMKPGITGWAQIHGWRGATDTSYQLRKRVEHDIEYVENWTLWLDIKILLRTAYTGFRSPNAF